MCCLQVELLVRLRISHIISNRYLKLGNISASIGRMILDSHPAVQNKPLPVFFFSIPYTATHTLAAPFAHKPCNLRRRRGHSHSHSPVNIDNCRTARRPVRRPSDRLSLLIPNCTFQIWNPSGGSLKISKPNPVLWHVHHRRVQIDVSSCELNSLKLM